MKMKKYSFILVIFCLFFAANLGAENLYSPSSEEVTLPEIEVFYSVRKGSITQDYEIFITNEGRAIIIEKDYYISQCRIF